MSCIDPLPVKAPNSVLVTCPFCLRKVLPKSDNCCPACNTPVDEDAPEPVHEIVTLKKGQQLPVFCFNCGIPATSFTMVKFEGVAMTHRVAGRFILGRLMTGLFGGGSSGRLMRGVHGSGDSFRIDLPSCASCTDMDETKFLRGTDQASRTVRIVVHRDFVTALKSGG